MLTVDVDENAAGLPQQQHRNGLAVDVCPGAAVRRQNPAHHELVAALDRLLLQPAQQSRRRLAQIEGRGDLGPLGPVADHFRSAAAAGQQLQRIDQDRFAGAGLAGEHRESRVELELDGLDDGEVADLQSDEHGGSALGVAAAPVQLRAQQTEVVVAGWGAAA